VGGGGGKKRVFPSLKKVFVVFWGGVGVWGGGGVGGVGRTDRFVTH